MPFPRPTLATLRSQGRAAIVSALGLLVPTLQRWLIGVVTDMFSAMLNGAYGYLSWVVAQLFVSTAEGSYIDRQGNELAVYRKGATQAAGGVVFTGTTGSVIPAGTPLVSSDQTQNYTVQTTGTISSGTTIDLEVVSTLAASAANQAPGGTLTITTAVAGVQATATIDSGGLTGGTDVESDTLYRARVLARKQQPPQGGANSDYIAWTKTVAQVTRAWVFPRNRGGGTVDVTFVCDGRSDIIPVSGDIAAVEAAVAPLKPGQVDFQAFACVADPVAVTVANLTPNTPAVQAAITASLQALFATTTPGQARYGDGVSEIAPGGILLLEEIDLAISQAAGVTGYDLVAPTADVVEAFGSLSTLGTVTIT